MSRPSKDTSFDSIASTSQEGLEEGDPSSSKEESSTIDKRPSTSAPAPKQCRLSTKGHKGSSMEESSTKDKRPSTGALAPKQCRLSTKGPKGSSKRQTSAKGKRPSPSSAQAPKRQRLFTVGHKGPSRIQTSTQGKSSSPSGSRALKRQRLLTDSHKGSSKRQTSAKSPKRRRLSTDSDTGHDLSSLVVRILKAEYNRRSLLRPLPWQNTFKLPLDDVYTRLTIVSRRKTDFQLQRNEVNMYDVFNTLSKGKDAMVLVEGSPGIGKTTFSLKISHDWSNEKIPQDLSFPEFELVLLLKCRDIHGDIMEAIREQLLPEDMDEKVRRGLMDYIKDIHNQENILIILDGLDELPRAGENHVDKLLHRRILPFCYVLATSRQERGIVVRQKVDFDILLQIEGFTEEDAFEYIRKHFRHFGPEHSPKGERLIQAIHENTFLHALPSNPLNLLLLCVVFEDYKGELPSIRTELYQIIVRCILRRYCAKHNLEAPDDDKALEEQFEDSLLALGQLAWRCLQEGRLSFREAELAKFERLSKNKDLAARKLGLVSKEASAKRINPQHEYHFFHKTFQEYLAASYLAHKLLKEQVNVFHDFKLEFNEEITSAYRQVFLFVSGILGEEASVLFKQIGEKLKTEHWDWVFDCSDEEATFFTECFSESRNAEQVAMTLCSFIPFPLTVDINSNDVEDSAINVLTVLNACKSFSQLQHPTDLTVVDEEFLAVGDINTIADFLASCPQLKTLSLNVHLSRLTLEQTTALFNGLSANSSLSSFTLKTKCSMSSDEAVVIGNSLAANKTLTTVTFELINEWDKHWATALETGLSADTPLTSVVLKIYSSMSDSSIQALKTVLLNRSLTSLVLIIYGDMQDSLATAVGEGLAAEPMLKSLSLIVYGKLSCAGAISLKRGFLENRSMNSLEVKVFGDLPDNWATVIENVFVAKKSVMSLTVHPNIIGSITNAQVARLCPILRENSLTLNLCGELSYNGAESLCKLLIASSTSCLTLNIHGRVTDDIADCLVRYLKLCTTLSFLRINIWGELTKDGNRVLRELYNQKYAFVLIVCGLISDDCICKDLDFSIDVSSLLTSVFTKTRDTCASKLILNITTRTDANKDWGHGLGDGLAKNTSLTNLSLTINNYSDALGGLLHGLGDGLAKNTSLTNLSLTINNYSGALGGLVLGLDDGLAKNTSLTNLSLTINNYSGALGDLVLGLDDGLAKNTSLTTLSVTVTNYSGALGGLVLGLGEGLAKNTSLTNLSLTINNYSGALGGLVLGLDDGLAKNTSLTNLSLTINNYSGALGDLVLGLDDGLAKNTSLTTLSVTVTNYSGALGGLVLGLGDGLAKNTSLTTLSVTVSNYSGALGGLVLGLGEGLAKNTSLTNLSLTINSYSGALGDLVLGLDDGLAKNTSLTTLSVTVTNYSGALGGLVLGLGDGLAKNTSLTTLSVTVTNYSGALGGLVLGLGDGLAKNTSLTTLSVTVTNYSGALGVLVLGLGDGLAKNTSLTTLSVTVTNYIGALGGLVLGLGEGLAKNTSLTNLSLTINSYSGALGDLVLGLDDGLAKNTSLTTLSVTVTNYSGALGGLVLGLGDGLAKNTSLTTLSVTVTNYSGALGGLVLGLGEGLAKNTSLTNLSLTINSYSGALGGLVPGLGDGLAKNTSLTNLSLQSTTTVTYWDTWYMVWVTVWRKTRH
ncbi:NACHT, LRR and PYD domains-containing protein [Desmophyllum pertusum]|uniref:NACHT, LRR and PYD domains-containing protein n=1 Tax=Desmophyllum pertusum TaxID=174260 RepID=A0A9X0CWJ6_9CNID|nr:NACHT, LRR and PYD domains-containing protein [Desmophyllum pertusum]